MRFNQRYDYQRAKYKDPTIISGQFTLIEEIIIKYRIQDIDIYNFNKTRFIIGIILIVIVVISLERASRAKVKQPSNREQVIVIQAINVISQLLPLFIVMKGKNILLSQYNEFKIPKAQRLAISDNRQTINNIRLEQIQHFE